MKSNQSAAMQRFGVKGYRFKAYQIAVAAVAASVWPMLEADAGLVTFHGLYIQGSGNTANDWNSNNYWTPNVPSSVAPGDDILFDYNYEDFPINELDLNGSHVVNSLNFNNSVNNGNPAPIFTLAVGNVSNSTLTISSGNIFNQNYPRVVFNSAVVSSNPVVISGQGELDFNSSSNALSGGVQLTTNSGSGLVYLGLGNVNTLNGGPTLINGGGLVERLTAPGTITQPIMISPPALNNAGGGFFFGANPYNGFFSLNLSTGNLTIASSISGGFAAAQLNINQTTGASGTSLRLNGNSANTYSNYTNVGTGVTLVLAKPAGVTAIPAGLGIAGTVVLQASNQIANASDVTLSGGTLNLNGFADTIGSLAGTGTVSLGSATLTTGGNAVATTFNGGITGTGSLVKIGGGVQTLAGANSFTGSVLVSAGILQLGSTSALGNASSVTVANNATLDLNGQTVAANIPLTIGGAGVGGNGALVNTSLTAATYAGAVTIHSPTTFGGVGDIALSGAMNGSGGIIENGYNTVKLTGPASFTGGVTVNRGTLAIYYSNSTYSGGINLNGGTLSVASGADLGTFGNPVTFANGATLQAVASFNINLPLSTSTSGVFSISPGAIIGQTGGLSGSGSFAVTGGGTLQSVQYNPFAGALTVVNGTLSVGGIVGAFPNVTSINLLTNGTLELDSSLSVNHTTQDRINDGAPIYLAGGTVDMEGSTTAATTEVFGQLLPLAGASSISLTSHGNAVTATFSSLAPRALGGTIGFYATGLGNTNKIFFTTPPVANNMAMGGGYTVNGSDFAKYNTSVGVVPFEASDYTTSLTSNTSSNLLVTNAEFPMPLRGTQSFATLKLDATSTSASLDASGPTPVNLVKGGLIKTGANPATISTLSLTSSGGELDISVTGGTLTLDSPIFGSSLVLTKRGPGILAFTGTIANNYSGFTLVSGEMDLNKSGAYALAGNVTVNGGTLLSLASGQFNPNSVVTLNYGTWNLNGMTDHITQLNNNTGTMLFNHGTLNVSGGVVLSGGQTTIASTVTSSTLTVSGGINTLDSTGIATVTDLSFLGSSPALQINSGLLNLKPGGTLAMNGTGTATIVGTGTGKIDLQNSDHNITVNANTTLSISAAITDGTFTATGGGTLLLGGVNSFSSLTLAAGTTVIAVSNASLGTASIVFAGGTLELASDLSAIALPKLTAGAANNSSVSFALNSATPNVSAGIFTIAQLNGSNGSALTLTTSANGSTGSLNAGTAVIQYSSSSPSSPWFIHNTATLNLGVPIPNPPPYEQPMYGINQTGVPANTNIDVQKDLTGTLVLSKLNNFGNLNVGGGTVVLSSTTGLAVPHDLRIYSGGTVQLLYANQISPTATITINGAGGQSTLDLNGNNNTLANLNFNAGGMVTTGSGVLNLSGGIIFSGIAGTATINGNLNLGSTTPTFDISASSSGPSLIINANISGGTSSNPIGINKVGAGVLALYGNNTFNGPITIIGGALQMAGGTVVPITISPGTAFITAPNATTSIALLRFGTITLTGAAQFNVSIATASSSREFIITPALNLSGAQNTWQGKVDLANNDLDVSGGSLANITNQIKQGYNTGVWTGTGGITSTSAAGNPKDLATLGVLLNNQNGSTIFNSSKQFDGYTPAPTDVLVKYTYYGDSNLDGKVDGSDYSRIDAAFVLDQSNATAATGWYNGDFNYDGLVNGSDYTLIDNAFNSQGATLTSQIADPSATITDQVAAAVPEPTCAALAALGIMSQLRRRRPLKK